MAMRIALPIPTGMERWDKKCFKKYILNIFFIFLTAVTQNSIFKISQWIKMLHLPLLKWNIIFTFFIGAVSFLVS